MAPSLKECVYNKAEAIKQHLQDDRKQHRCERAKGVCLVQIMCPAPLDLAVTGPLAWLRARPLAGSGHRLVRKGISAHN